MAVLFTLPLRIAQAVFAIVVLGLTAYVANWWGGFWHAMSPSEINFLIFASAWTILALIYLIVAPWKVPDAAHKFGILAAEAVTMIFWFAGFIALAVFLGDRVCYGHVCSAAKAAAAFAAFEWAVFAATTTIAVIHVVRTRNTTRNDPPPEMEVHQGV